MPLPENIDPIELEELARISGVYSPPIPDNPEDSIPLLHTIKGPKGYKKRLREAAHAIYGMLYDEYSEALPRRPKPAHLTALEYILHSLAHIASVPLTRKLSRLRFVAISRTAAEFVSGSEYGHLSYAAFTKLLDCLEAYDPENTGQPWLEVKAAYHNRLTEKGRRTRIKARRSFCDWMVQQRLIFPWHPKGTTANQSKSKSSKSLLWISYKGNGKKPDEAKLLDRELLDDEVVLTDLNKALCKQSIHCELETYTEYEKLYDYKVGKPQHSFGGNREIYRQFSEEDGRGGRLYGHWVQSLPKWVRQRLTIDGKPTVELDYSSMQLVLLYSLCDAPLSKGEDLYALPGMTHSRDDMKLVLTRSVGNGTRTETIASIRNTLKEQNRTFAKADKLYDDFWEHHADVSPHEDGSNEAAWPRLQNLDSQIALRVLRKLLNQGITAIPIHDSFIVQSHHADAAELVMQEAFAELCPGLRIGIKRS